MKRDIQLRVEAALPHRLVDRATREGILLSEAFCPDDHTLIATLSPRDARKLSHLCRRYRLPVHLERLGGSGATMAFLRRRATLLAGIVAFLTLSLLALGRIWFIDVAFTGNAPVPGSESQILSALSDLGVCVGCSRGFDAGNLAMALNARLPGYSYIGLRPEGVLLRVEASPEEPRPELYRVDAARDLCARRAGIVLNINVRAGQACVQPGDTVRRGQLLIRGEELDRDEASRPIAALGEVMLRTWAEGIASLPIRVEESCETGRESLSSALLLFGRRIPLTRGEGFVSQRIEEERLPIVGLFLPVQILRERHREIQTVPVRQDVKLLQNRLATLAQADARLALSRDETSDTAIVRQWLQYEISGGQLTAHAVLEITTDAAVTREALYQGG